MPEAEPVIVRRVYPANVTTPDGIEHRGVLAIVTQKSVCVWASQGGGAVLVFDQQYVQPDLPLPHVAQLRSVPLVLAMPEGVGGLVQIQSVAGCGCGSPLKSYQPFTPEVTGPTR